MTLFVDGSSPRTGDTLVFDIEESKLRPGQLQAHNISGGTGWAEGGKISRRRCAAWGEDTNSGANRSSHISQNVESPCSDTGFQTGSDSELLAALGQERKDNASLKQALKRLQF